MTTLAIIRRAMRRALQWRLLLVSPIVLWVAAAATLLPLAHFLGELFDHSPRWQEITASLDSPALLGLVKALTTPAAAGLASGIETSLVLALVFAPFLAGAALFVAQTDAPPRLRPLLAGAGAYYGRLLRMQFAALLPLAAVGLMAALAFGWASHVSDRATSEAATHTSGRLALLLTLLALFLGQLAIDAGRARLAAEPHRRSALLALGAGVKLVIKRPLQTLAIGLSSTLVAFLVAAVLLVLRQQITQSGVAALLLAFLLAQLAVAAIAWGHAARLAGLVEIARELAASRSPAPVTATAGPAEPTEPVEPGDLSTDDVPEPVGSALPATPSATTEPIGPAPAEPAPAAAPPES
jgi:hypothetical protein